MLQTEQELLFEVGLMMMYLCRMAPKSLQLQAVPRRPVDTTAIWPAMLGYESHCRVLAIAP